jgi:pyruvate formate lyase activating enzyme
VSTLEKVREIGKAEGLKFVYVGNVPGHPYENTYCPKCNHSLIKRYGFSITDYSIGSDKRCPHCGEEIPIIVEPQVPSINKIE